MGTSISRRTAVLLGVFGPLALAECSQSADRAEGEKNDGAPRLSPLGEPTPVTLDHATKFTLDAYEGGYRLASLASGDRLLVVPEGVAPPAGLPGDVAVVRQPLANVYLVSTGMICLVDAIGALDAIGVSSVRAEDSPVPAFTERLEDGTIAYGGLYRAPDYELITAKGCPLAIENTNIDHVPEVFVIAGGGTGATCFRRLARGGVPFATGVLHEHDTDGLLARSLATLAIFERDFEPVSAESVTRAREVLLACREVVCCVSGFGTTNARNAELLDAARAAGIPVRHEGSRAN